VKTGDCQAEVGLAGADQEAWALPREHPKPGELPGRLEGDVELQWCLKEVAEFLPVEAAGERHQEAGGLHPDGLGREGVRVGVH